jgi:hypothetical protein
VSLLLYQKNKRTKYKNIYKPLLSFDHQKKKETTFPFSILWGMKALLSCCLFEREKKKKMLQIYFDIFSSHIGKMYNDAAAQEGGGQL